ncbi:MAG: malate dehydrogenase [Candidatus Latescibacteria bacterium]|nr:malate dehydrogenase [Candidatus Latescibacterota bacterium]NIM21466.1 malate dehydrogenase [Candidatus Latescibacterota bacterium]NIM65637.1 malate dehydrogenase [Candidatus Latescibacterota bacterium]NIO02019.1 malate dehydrogenase [Candidatus Latescibacterota bacterium]NIO28831.1 malate dehydrogenase [Candidatus Latescibacterota bacterium]
MLNKIGLIGGGYIGGVLAQEIARRGLSREVGLSDPAPIVNPEDPPERQDVTKKQSVSIGKCLDISEGLPTIRSDVRLVGSKDYSAIAGSDLIINTAGIPRKARPDGTYPSREELLAVNLKVTNQVAEGIRQNCPDAIIISIANPLDAIVYTLDKRLNPPKNKLMGMAGQLDSGRYCYFVADAAKVSVENVNAIVLGGHGDTMVPVRSSCMIAGIPVSKFLDEEILSAIETRTRKAGGEVVGLLGFGSAFVSPAWAALDMAEAIVYDKRKILPTCAKLEGEYGVDGLFVGVPAILGKNGVEQVVELDLTDEEKEAFKHSVGAVRKTCDEVDEMLEKL